MTVKSEARKILAGKSRDVYLVFFSSIAVMPFFGGRSSLAGIPEKKIVKYPKGSLSSVILEPFKDVNFRQLLVFLGSWNFAINLAAPFFYAQKNRSQYGAGLTLSVLSQVVNVLFMRLWGYLADRFNNKSVLAEADPLFILSILKETTTRKEGYDG
ncbi:MAG TPA: hypothetical protein HPQ03_08865 [Deltaproteobacteria bacterium]|nr:hypothetical protein [Deltaproteobacteria bacterium]